MLEPRCNYPYCIALAGAILLTACSDINGPTETRRLSPAILLVEAVGPTDFEGVVGTTITPEPAIRVVRDSVARTPVPGVNVVFTLHLASCFGPSCPIVQVGVVPTDANGIASIGGIPLGTVAGSYKIMAKPEEAPSLSWSVTILPGPVARLTVMGGNDQRGEPGTQLPRVLRVHASDAFNNPVGEGVSVTFSVTAGGGSITDEAALTDSGSIATSGRWTLGAAGPQEVTARSGEAGTVFSASFCAADHPCISLAQLAFVRDGNVFMSDASGSNPSLLVSQASKPAWSRDGSRIVFVRSSNGKSQICIAEPDGNGIRCTTDELQGQVWGGPAWSPDGSKLIVSSGTCGEWSGCAFQTHMITTSTMQLVGLATPSLRSLSWSPDGEKIAYVASSGELGVMNSDGTEAQILKSEFPQYDGAWEVAWSPDGEKLALLLYWCWGDCYEALAVTDIRATTIMTTAQYGWLRGVTWSPDGRITYTHYGWGNDWEIVSVNPNGGPRDPIEVLLTNATSPSWRPVP
jgi:hypothetical protein